MTRQTRSTRIALLPLGVSFAAALAGCGGGTGASTPPMTSPPSATAPASTPASAQGGNPAGSQAPVPAESNPPGDIPDSVAYVPYRDAGAGFRFTHPEGWTQRSVPGGVSFGDKLNGVTVTSTSSSGIPSPSSARSRDLPTLQRTQPAFELRSVSTATVRAGRGVLIVYRRNSAADPVTGKRYRDEVQRYELLVGKRLVVMELFGPVGADNVDPYRIMVDSLRKS